MAIGYALSSTIALTVWGRLLERYDPRRVLLFSTAAAGLTHIPLLFLQTPLQLVLTRIAFGLAASLMLPANTDGGILALGIVDPASASGKARLYGIEENPEALDELSRKTITHFNPALGRLHWLRLPCTLRDGKPGHIVLLRVEKSDAVHSIIDDGTWMRMRASNRKMTAVEIAELHYRRGVRSAAGEAVPVAMELLETDV